MKSIAARGLPCEVTDVSGQWWPETLRQRGHHLFGLVNRDYPEDEDMSDITVGAAATEACDRYVVDIHQVTKGCLVTVHAEDQGALLSDIQEVFDQMGLGSPEARSRFNPPAASDVGQSFDVVITTSSEPFGS